MTADKYSASIIKDTILSRVQVLLSQRHNIDPKQIRYDTSVTHELGLYSLDLIELMMDLEKEYNIKIPDVPQEPIQTVGNFIELIAKHMQR
ncbi:MAG: acyl carrier protein [Alphaproteobacteria bacterium]|nr:acyl carrier protein [Alphaproteobacteria bacterium]